MRLPSPPVRFAAIALIAAALFGVGAAAPRYSSASQSLGQLNSNLGQNQSRQQQLSSRVGSLSGLISSLSSQIALVTSREAALRVELAADRQRLATVQSSLARERTLLGRLRERLARARLILSHQLISGYEGDRPDIATVVLEARGFTDLLERLDFLKRAQQQQQTIIGVTRVAKAQADASAGRLAALEATDKQITATTAIRVSALAGMDSLLRSKQGALRQARAIQLAELGAVRARGKELQRAIARLQAQQAAAAAAASARSSSGSGATSYSGPALGPSGGWAIPYAIVLCESGGQNLPPNSAGASGYYQIMPATWKGAGGTGPAAYLASKAEQDAVAARIWNGGAGASNWVCAGIVGIH
jgi:septal ring factor EnvC (AmiA/AmiB activator)